MKVTITIEGKQGEGKSTVARELLDAIEDLRFPKSKTFNGSDVGPTFNFNTYLSDDGTVERRTSSQYPHSVVITTITTDGESR